MMFFNKLVAITCLFSILFLFSHCSSIDQLTQFEISYNSAVVIPATTGINLPIDLNTPDIESNATATFEINDTRKDLIESIVLQQLNLNLTQPTSGDFSFLKSIEIYISAEGLSEIRMAYKENIDDSVGNVLVLQTVDNDLQEYIKKDQFSLRVATVTDKLITADQHIDINAVFFVDAKILGV